MQYAAPRPPGRTPPGRFMGSNVTLEHPAAARRTHRAIADVILRKVGKGVTIGTGRGPVRSVAGSSACSQGSERAGRADIARVSRNPRATQCCGVGAASARPGSRSASVGCIGIQFRAIGIDFGGHGILRAGHGIGFRGHGMLGAGHGIEFRGHGIGFRGHGILRAGHGIEFQGHGMLGAGIGIGFHGLAIMARRRAHVDATRLRTMSEWWHQDSESAANLPIPNQALWCRVAARRRTQAPWSPARESSVWPLSTPRASHGVCRRQRRAL